MGLVSGENLRSDHRKYSGNRIRSALPDLITLSDQPYLITYPWKADDEQSNALSRVGNDHSDLRGKPQA